MCGGEQPIPAEAKGEKNAIASVLFLLASIDPTDRSGVARGIRTQIGARAG
jgi:hypothetical protein